MQTQLGRPVCGGELYAGIFWRRAACKLIQEPAAPATSAASLFPRPQPPTKGSSSAPMARPKSVREIL